MVDKDVALPAVRDSEDGAPTGVALGTVWHCCQVHLGVVGEKAIYRVHFQTQCHAVYLKELIQGDLASTDRLVLRVGDFRCHECLFGDECFQIQCQVCKVAGLQDMFGANQCPGCTEVELLSVNSFGDAHYQIQFPVYKQVGLLALRDGWYPQDLHWFGGEYFQNRHLVGYQDLSGLARDVKEYMRGNDLERDVTVYVRGNVKRYDLERDGKNTRVKVANCGWVYYHLIYFHHLIFHPHCFDHHLAHILFESLILSIKTQNIILNTSFFLVAYAT